ncbi:MAG: T4 family baseplate hub assembly chaperone [Armatimonadota bacterium]
MYPFTLPTGLDVELREMTGTEEELLTNPRLLRSGDAVNQVLRNCLVKLGEKTEVSITDVLDLLAGDRLFLLVKLRQISLGDDVALAVPCPNAACRATLHLSINIDDLPVTPYPPAREFACMLPGSRQLVRFGYLDGHKEKRLAALPEATITSAMLIRILDIDGNAPNKKTLTEMALRDRQALRQAMVEADSGINTTVDATCEQCGAPVKLRLEGDPAFFFPGAR